MSYGRGRGKGRLIDQAARAEALAAQVPAHRALQNALLREAWELREQIRGLADGENRSWEPGARGGRPGPLLRGALHPARRGRSPFIRSALFNLKRLTRFD